MSAESLSNGWITGMMYIEPPTPTTDQIENRRLTAYFEALGYSVGSDNSYREGVWWHEINDQDGTLICQIDGGARLADVIADFSSWAAGGESVSTGPDYEVRTGKPNNPRFATLLKRVLANPQPVIVTQPDLPLS